MSIRSFFAKLFGRTSSSAEPAQTDLTRSAILAKYVDISNTHGRNSRVATNYRERYKNDPGLLFQMDRTDAMREQFKRGELRCDDAGNLIS